MPNELEYLAANTAYQVTGASYNAYVWFQQSATTGTTQPLIYDQWYQQYGATSAASSYTATVNPGWENPGWETNAAIWNGWATASTAHTPRVGVAAPPMSDEDRARLELRNKQQRIIWKNRQRAAELRRKELFFLGTALDEKIS